ncbi:hypothetical protein SRHO_G00017740 [Serrasalmus rhombeus]
MDKVTHSAHITAVLDWNKRPIAELIQLHSSEEDGRSEGGGEELQRLPPASRLPCFSSSFFDGRDFMVVSARTVLFCRGDAVDCGELSFSANTKRRLNPAGGSFCGL